MNSYNYKNINNNNNSIFGKTLLLILLLFLIFLISSFLSCALRGNSDNSGDSGTEDDGNSGENDNHELKHPLTDGVDNGEGLFTGYTFADAISDYTGTELENYPKTKATNGVRGAGDMSGSLDVFVVGDGEEFIISWEGKQIINGSGIDFKVFENGFYTGGKITSMSLDLGIVSVSKDGITWYDIPVTYDDTNPEDSPEGKIGFVGTTPVYLNMSEVEIIPPKSKEAGGDGFDLSDVGINEGDYVKYVKIIDGGDEYPDGQVFSNGIDIDGVCAFYWKNVE